MSRFFDFISNLPFPTLTRFQCVLMIIILIPTTIALLSAPWVPTPSDRVKKMLALAKIKPGEKVYDLGCGDGRMVHFASILYKAKAVGLEFSPLIYAMAKMFQPIYWLKGSRAKILFRNFYKKDLSDANVIVFYLLPHAIQKLKPKWKKELKKGTRIVSYAFQIEGWTPTHRQKRIRKKSFCPLWLYTIGESDKVKK